MALRPHFCSRLVRRTVAGIAASPGMIATTMPLLRRITGPWGLPVSSS